MATQLATEEAPQVVETGDIANEEAQTQARDYEAEARERGWTPKEEFRGDESRWIDAETFVKNAETKMPLLSKENKQLKDKIDYLERTVKRLTKAEQNAYNSALEDLKRQQREAVEYGDVNAYEQIDKKIDKLRVDMQEDVAPQNENPAVAFAEFQADNEWYGLGQRASATDTERRASNYADTLAEKYKAQGLQLQMSPSEFFGKIADEVRARYPELAGETVKTPRAKPPSDVAGVTRPNGARNMRNGASLPADAKAQADRFFAQGIYPKAKNVAEARDLYAKSYAWD